MRKQPLFLLLLLVHLHSLGNAVGLAGVDGLAGLLDLLEDGGVVEALVGLDGSGLGVEGDVEFFDTCEGGSLAKEYGEVRLRCAYADKNQLTLELLEHALDGAGAAAAGHGDVELVVVLGHFGDWWVGCEVV